jgi:hypothetical protein
MVDRPNPNPYVPDVARLITTDERRELHAALAVDHGCGLRFALAQAL